MALRDGGVINARADSELVVLFRGPDVRIGPGLAAMGSGGVVAFRSDALGQKLRG